MFQEKYKLQKQQGRVTLQSRDKRGRTRKIWDIGHLHLPRQHAHTILMVGHLALFSLMFFVTR